MLYCWSLSPISFLFATCNFFVGARIISDLAHNVSVRAITFCFRPQVDVASYVRDCQWDACGCSSGGDCECLCTAISAYANACADKGIHVPWRSTFLCRE
jgi:hypothetical protein